MIDREIMNLLACPACGNPVRQAPEDLISHVNAQILEGRLRNTGGTLVQSSLDGGLICENEHYLYPVRKQIPLMLASEALPLN